MANLNKKSTTDLQKQLLEKREELRQFRFGASGSKVRNIKAGRSLRKEISRTLTELRQREINANTK